VPLILSPALRIQALLDRITASKSVFDRTKWAKEREAEEKYISLIRKDDTNGYLPQSSTGHSVFYRSLPIDSAAAVASPSRPATRTGYALCPCDWEFVWLSGVLLACPGRCPRYKRLVHR
jgi:hypothetical protein